MKFRQLDFDSTKKILLEIKSDWILDEWDECYNNTNMALLSFHPAEIPKNEGSCVNITCGNIFYPYDFATLIKMVVIHEIIKRENLSGDYMLDWDDGVLAYFSDAVVMQFHINGMEGVRGTIKDAFNYGCYIFHQKPQGKFVEPQPELVNELIRDTHWWFLGGRSFYQGFKLILSEQYMTIENIKEQFCKRADKIWEAMNKKQQANDKGE